MNIQDRTLNFEQEKIAHSVELFVDYKVPSSEIVCNIKEEMFTVDEYLENAETSYLDKQHINTSLKNITNENIEISEINAKFSQSKITTEGFSRIDYIKEEQAEGSFCENCQDLIQDFCLKCTLPLYILNNEIPTILDDDVEEALPRNVLIIKEINNHEKGVFTLRTIPKDTEFGPFCGLTISKKERGFIWKIKNGKLLSGENSQYLNWMQHIRSIKDTSRQNLTVFQHKGDIYFRSNEEITKGSELFVHYGLDGIKYINDEAAIHYCPGVERKLRNIYACTFCCVGFSSEVNLVKHKNKCPHETIRDSLFNIITQCPLCKIYLLEREYKELHLTYCNKIDENSPASEINFTGNGKAESFACKVCDKNFAEEKHLEVHLKHKHNPSRGSDSKKHSGTHKSTKRFQCALCDKQFDRNDRLQLHVKDKHLDSKNKTYKCSACAYQTNRKKSFQVHLHRHSDKKPFACIDCGAQFIQKQYLQLHMKKMHSSVDQKEYKCSRCPYETDRKSNMRRHMTVHTVSPEDKIYKCPNCPFESNHRDSLYRHQHIHDEIKRYECKMCKQRFNFRQNLTVHVKYVHNVVEENYNCTKCSYQTNRKDSLKRHLYSHGEVKPYKCKVCDKQFIRSSNLKQHLINIHKETV